MSGQKIWDDNNNEAGKRPDAITIHLIADAAEVAEVASKTVTAADGWAWIFTDLPAVDEYNLPIEYKIAEDPVTGYTTTYNGYNVTNRLEREMTSATVVKKWEDNNLETMRPNTLKVTLYSGAKAIRTVFLSAANGWKATVDNLPAYENGALVTYTWKEQEVLGYTLTDQHTDGKVTYLTNSLWVRPEPTRGGNVPKHAGTPEKEIDDYGTPLGLGIIINHVGDCFD
ncbi:MAG: Cna B-type domain-containing protein [Clostridia bacterium]|nr:Cna B-type domain-containing protein [Clostridia bacterium]